jgi:two-component system alkaline phosphatase synthesis response regulator PhoP
MFALKNSGYRVEGFGNAKDFFAKLSEKTPDLILLDVMLPDLDGLSILKKVRTVPDTKKTPVIFVSAKTSEIDKVKGLDMGADDYLAKPFGVMELISRVKALLRRSNAASEEKTLALGEIQIDNEKHCVYVGNRLCELTYKEFELLKMMMQNVGIVLTRDRIMDRVWGTDYEGESRTLDMHIKTLRKKLGEEGIRIKTVRNVGYVLE